MGLTKFKCAVCGKLTAGRLPIEGNLPGDGTKWWPRRHKVNGTDCPGNIVEALLIDLGPHTYDKEKKKWIPLK